MPGPSGVAPARLVRPRRLLYPPQMIDCLACGKRNEPADLLCVRCGAPLPDRSAPSAEVPPVAAPEPDEAAWRVESRARRARRQRKVLWLAVGGVLLAGGVVAAWYFLRDSTVPSTELVRRMPEGALGVGGMDFGRILRNEQVKKLLDNPLVKTGIEQLGTRAGVHVDRLGSMAAAVRIHEGELQFLFVVLGKFEPDKLHSQLGSLGHMRRKDVAGASLFLLPGHRLTMPFSGGDDDDPEPTVGDGESGEPPPAGRTDTPDAKLPAGGDPAAAPVSPKPPEGVPHPPVAGTGAKGARAARHRASRPVLPIRPSDIVLGCLDSRTFVMGTPILVEGFVDGTSKGPGEEIIRLVDRVDRDAIAWSVGRFDDRLRDLLKGTLLLGPEVLDQVTGAAFVYQVHLASRALRFRVGIDLPTEAVARQVEQVMSAAKALTGGLGVLGVLTGAGGAASKGLSVQVERTGASVDVRLSIPIPDFGGFGL